jgi:large subunit ribosomal protein L22
MEVRARHKNARMSARKLRVLRGAVRGLPVLEAEAQLQYLPGEAAQIILKVLRSAIANAQHNFEIAKETLKVADIIIDGAFTMKRHRPVSKGMAHAILKRSAHVTVVVEDTGTAGAARPGKKSEIKTVSLEELAEHTEETPSTSVEEHDHEGHTHTTKSLPRSGRREQRRKSFGE